MQIALSSEGVRTQIRKEHRFQRYSCPTCKSIVIGHCGEIVSPYWAHESLSECDPWGEGESEWHVGWKSRWPESCREVVVGPHRADIKIPRGTVVEFQHSPISTEEIREREAFYGDMVWVFDAGEVWDRLRLWHGGAFNNPLGDLDRAGEHHYLYEWQRCRPSIGFCEKPVYLDLGWGNIMRIQRRGDDPFPEQGVADMVDADEFVSAYPGAA